MKPKSKPTQVNPIARVASEILYALVREPDSLKISDNLIGTILAIEIEAHESDRPKLIGSNGKHIAAFTRILKSMGTRRGLEVVVDLIVPPIPPRYSHQQQFAADPNWKPEAIIRLLQTVCSELFGRHDFTENTLKNMTVYQLHYKRWELSSDVLAALDTLFEAIGYRQGHVVHIAGEGVYVAQSK